MVFCYSTLNWLKQFVSRNYSGFQWLRENSVIGGCFTDLLITRHLSAYAISGLKELPQRPSVAKWLFFLL